MAYVEEGLDLQRFLEIYRYMALTSDVDSRIRTLISRGQGDRRVYTNRLYTASSGLMRDHYNACDPNVNPPGYFCVIDTVTSKVLRKVRGYPAESALILANIQRPPRVLVAFQDFMGGAHTTVRDANGEVTRHNELPVLFPPFPAPDPSSGVIYFASDLRDDPREGMEVVTIRRYNTRTGKTGVVLPSAPYPKALAAVSDTGQLFLGVVGTDAVFITRSHALSR